MVEALTKIEKVVEEARTSLKQHPDANQDGSPKPVFIPQGQVGYALAIRISGDVWDKGEELRKKLHEQINMIDKGFTTRGGIHLNVLNLTLHTPKEDVERCCETLTEATPIFQNFVNKMQEKGGAHIHVKGLDEFNNGRVIFARPESQEEVLQLCCIHHRFNSSYDLN